MRTASGYLALIALSSTPIKTMERAQPSIVVEPCQIAELPIDDLPSDLWNLIMEYIGYEQYMKIVHKHTGVILSLIFDSGGNQLATLTRNKETRLFCIKTGQLLQLGSVDYAGDDQVYSMLCDTKNNQMATYGSFARIWDKEGKFLRKLDGHDGALSAMTCNPKKDLLASASQGCVLIHNDITGQLLHKFKSNLGLVSTMAYNPQGDILTAAGASDFIYSWGIDGKALQTLKTDYTTISSIAYSPTGKHLVSGGLDMSKIGPDSKVNIWDCESGALVQTLRGHRHSVNNVCYNSIGDCILTSSYDKTVKTWDAKSGQELQSFDLPVSAVSAAFNPRDPYMFAVCYNNVAQLYAMQRLKKPISSVK